MITHDLMARANKPGRSAHDLSVTLRWDPEDPYAVAMDMARTSTEVVTWYLSRGVLAGREWSRGDVRVVRLGAERIKVTLSSDNGTYELLFNAAEVWAFLAETMEACPFGTEKVDVDGIIAKILGAEA